MIKLPNNAHQLLHLARKLKLEAKARMVDAQDIKEDNDIPEYWTFNNPYKNHAHGFSAELINQIITFLTTNQLPEGIDKDTIARFHGYYKQNNFWDVKEGKLYFKGREVIPSDAAVAVLQLIYDDPATTANGRDRLFHTVNNKYAGITRKMVVRGFILLFPNIVLS